MRICLPLPPLDLAKWFRGHAGPVLEQAADGLPVNAASPDLLYEMLLEVLDVLDELTHRPATGMDQTHGPDISELGDYGLRLLAEMSVLAGQMGLPDNALALERLTVPFALWLSEHGAELRTLEPIVNALALAANQTQELRDLQTLFQCMSQVHAAICPALLHNVEDTNPHRPLKILLFNRGIIATRLCQPLLMQQAFNAITQYLPDEAAGFFVEGIGQLDLIGYPQEVRKVMERYFAEWGPTSRRFN